MYRLLINRITSIMNSVLCSQPTLGQRKRLFEIEKTSPPTILDRSIFEREVHVLGLITKPQSVSQLSKELRNSLVKLKPSTFEQICDFRAPPGKKLLLLDPHLVTCYGDFSPPQKSLISKFEAKLVKMLLKIDYTTWPWKAVLRSLYGVSMASHTITGHILHVNFDDDFVPYRYVIGQVLLDKVHNVRTVVMKTSNISNTFRTMDLEVIAGENEMVTCVRENGVTFKMDFSKVYWNSRLSTEHEHVVKLTGPGTVVFDVCAGIGPFSIPSSIRGTDHVFANDLNPECYYWLNENIGLNRRSRNISTYNMDAVDFIGGVFKPGLTKLWDDFSNGGDKFPKVIVIMNLPASAVEFLPCFSTLGDSSMAESYKSASEKARMLDISVDCLMPNLYCYCFSQKCDDEAIEEIKDTVLSKFGGKNMCLHAIRRVRDVSPSKLMYCAEIGLTTECCT